MVTMKEIVEQVFVEPFRPFRIHTVSGRMFDIRRPDEVYVGVTRLTISTLFADSKDAVGPWYHLPLDSIETIEPLDVPVHGKG